MNRFSFIIACLLVSSGLFAQTDTIFTLVAAFTTTSQATDSTFTVTCTHPSDQLGQGFLPTGIQVGYYLADSRGYRYTVTVVTSADFGTSSITVKELQDNNSGPLGVGVIYRKPDDSDGIPIPPGGNSGPSPATLAIYHIHNVLNGGGSTSIDSALWATVSALTDTAADLRTDLITAADARGIVSDSLDLYRGKLFPGAPTGSTHTVDLENSYVGIAPIDLTGASSPLTLTVNNAQVGGVYTFHWLNASSNDIVYPATFYDESATTLGTVSYAAPKFITCYFDGANFYCK